MFAKNPQVARLRDRIDWRFRHLIFNHFARILIARQLLEIQQRGQLVSVEPQQRHIKLVRV